jgi:hypothetical protein
MALGLRKQSQIISFPHFFSLCSQIFIYYLVHCFAIPRHRLSLSLALVHWFFTKFVCLFIATRAIFQLSGGCHHCRWQGCKEVGPWRVKIGPTKWAKLKWSFDKLFSAWNIGHIWWFMKMVNFFEFFAFVPEIPSPKHHQIQEFANNYHISAIKINKMFVS